MKPRAHRWRRWLIGGAAVIVLVAFGGPLIYNNLSMAPAMLVLPTDQSAASVVSGATGLDGSWHVGASSLAGFRVPTSALGYRSTVVGRTHDVQGSIAISGNAVRTASFTVNVAGIDTSASARKLMDVSTHPKATFVLMHPIDLAGPPVDSTIQSYAATGALTVHGTTTNVTFRLSYERLGNALHVLANIPIIFSDCHISVPYGVENHGTLEVLLELVKGARNPI